MSDSYIGEIRIVAFDFAPRGWARCDGTLLAIAQNQALFSILGTTYGGDGRTTFALPNFRERIPVHTGMGPSTSNRQLGELGGTNDVTLLLPHLPSHDHAAMGSTNLAALASPASAVLARGDAPNFGVGVPNLPIPTALGSAGSTQPHENRQPFLALNFVICTSGFFPSRD